MELCRGWERKVAGSKVLMLLIRYVCMNVLQGKVATVGALWHYRASHLIR